MDWKRHVAFSPVLFWVLILAVKATLRAPLRSGLDRCGDWQSRCLPPKTASVWYGKWFGQVDDARVDHRR